MPFSRDQVYAGHRAHPALAGHVLCLWTMRSHAPVAEPLTVRVLPDGCMDLIFDLGGCLADRSAPDTFITGTANAPEAVSVAGRIDVLGVRFRPGGAGPLLDVQAGELANASIRARDMGTHSHALLLLAEALAETRRTEDRIWTLQDFLLRRLARAPEPDQRIRHSLFLLARHHGNLPIGALSKQAGTSRRTLERAFLEHTGAPPKLMARILRLRRAIELARATALPASALALEAGYFDQAHYSREFRRMTGATPAQFQAEARSDAFVQYELPVLD